jgi:hypothetical protein
MSLRKKSQKKKSTKRSRKKIIESDIASREELKKVLDRTIDYLYYDSDPQKFLDAYGPEQSSNRGKVTTAYWKVRV